MADQEFSPEFVARKWKKGQSGNPAGRPKRKSLETIMRDILEEIVTTDEGQTASKMEIQARLWISQV